MISKKKARKESKAKNNEKPMIIESDSADRGDKPNTCRGCLSSKFC